MSALPDSFSEFVLTFYLAKSMHSDPSLCWWRRLWSRCRLRLHLASSNAWRDLWAYFSEWPDGVCSRMSETWALWRMVVSCDSVYVTWMKASESAVARFGWCHAPRLSSKLISSDWKRALPSQVNSHSLPNRWRSLKYTSHVAWKPYVSFLERSFELLLMGHLSPLGGLILPILLHFLALL